MKKSKLLAAFAAVACGLSLASCGSKVGYDTDIEYNDGTYTGKSEVYENEEDADDSGYGVVTITILNNEIVACDYKTYKSDGTLKDADYGKESSNENFVRKAQRAVAACDVYAGELVSSQSLNGVTLVSGATYNYNEFVDAVIDALNQAKK